jgi:exopolysaccharide biosynthesis polyprenyl glycosylphosphotransferase
VVADVVSAAFAVAVGAVLLGEDSLNAWALLTLPGVVLVSKAIRLYDRDEALINKTTLDEAPALFHVATLYALLIWLSEGVIVEGYLGRDQVVGLWGLLFILMLVARACARWGVRTLTPSERCLVVGDPRTADSLHAKFALSSSLGGEIVGRVPLEDDRRRESRIPVVGSVETLGLVLTEHDVHRVIVAARTSDAEEILHTIRLVKSMGVKISVLPRLFEIVGSSVEFDNVDGVQLLALRKNGLSRSSRLLKRGMDLAGATIGATLLFPFLVMAAAAIKLDSRGPVFFRQHRIGRDGHAFEMLKFRTMGVDAEAQKAALREKNEAASGLFKIAEDPRVTRVGRLLRRTSLDELPQLWNIMTGHMSLVGPRPLVPDEDEKIEGWHRTRLQLDPGMTGFWQVSGSSRIPLPEMVKIDYLYGANWSLWLDVKILLRTVTYAVRRRGM